MKVYAVNRVTGERELLGDLEDFPDCDCDQLAGECCAKCTANLMTFIGRCVVREETCTHE